MLNAFMSRLMQQAQRVDDTEDTLAKYLRYELIIVTEENSYTSLGVTGRADFADFVNGHSDDLTVEARFLPSVYYENIWPYQDNLVAQLVTVNNGQRIVETFTAIPLTKGLSSVTGTRTSQADVKGVSQMTFGTYRFQLLPLAFAKLRDQVVSGITLMATVNDTLAYFLDNYTRQFTDSTEYSGLVMEMADNTDTYSAIVVPEGTPLIDLASFFQESDKYGLYAKGLGCYFRQKQWWVYPLYDFTLYDSHPVPVTFIRYPEDRFPTLERTSFHNNGSLTILVTGKGDYDDTSDIDKQDNGVGVRLVLPTKVSGETGSYYNAGRSISTRADSMSEFQMSDRASGNNYTPVVPIPSANPYKYSSGFSAQDGLTIQLEWHNSDTRQILPGQPCRYQYLDNNVVVTRKGVILSYRTDYEMANPQLLSHQRATVVMLYLGPVDTSAA